jgi:mannose-6-phosphate isomerase-like protein (cupin superfamily)
MGPGAEYLHPVGARKTLVEGPFSAVLLMAAGASRGKLSLVEHPLAPRALGSPMHTHSHEDEYSYILAGQVGAQVGEEVILARAGDVIAKPSGIPHAFWNASDEPARVLEIIAPGGFEDYFAGLGDLLAVGQSPAPDARQALGERFGLDLDVDSIPRLAAEHSLRLDG